MAVILSSFIMEDIHFCCNFRDKCQYCFGTVDTETCYLSVYEHIMF